MSNKMTILTDGLCDRNCVIIWTNRATCTFNKEILIYSMKIVWFDLHLSVMDIPSNPQRYVYVDANGMKRIWICRY